MRSSDTTDNHASNRTLLISIGSFGALIAAHATGVLGATTYAFVIVGAIICAFIGVRRHRPAVRWPWWALVLTGVLWTIAGVVR